MASLDVESSFTNIPESEIINNCVSDLHNKNLYNGKLSKRDLFKLLETAAGESSFTFITYFVSKLTESQWVLLWVPPLQMHFYAIMKKNGWIIVLSTLNLIYKRYVDDIFVLFSCKEHVQHFVDYMNKQHKCLKFTSEAQNVNSFLFLNIKITRHNQQFKISVYRKPTFSGVFTHYHKIIFKQTSCS